MTCTVPTVRSSLSEGTAATQLAETSCITSSGAEVFSAFHLLSPASLACFALSYIASPGLRLQGGTESCPSREPLPQARRLVASHGFVRGLTLLILVVTTGAHNNSASPGAGAMIIQLFSALAETGYFSMGAPMMLPYSVQEPS